MPTVEWDVVLRAEHKAICERRRNLASVDPNEPGTKIQASELHEPDDDDYRKHLLEPGRTALCISGGGIRSATFALGVIQALAKDDLLKRFDYLSTVSGGGYIGSSLTWLNRADNGQGFGLGPDTLPFGTAKPRDRADAGHSKPMMKFLRERGEYLIPGDGINVLSGIAVVLRGIVLNLIVWLPIFAAIFLVLLQEWNWLGFAPFLHDALPTLDRSDDVITGFEAIAGLAVVVGALFLLFCVAYSIGTRVAFRWKRRPQTYEWRRFFEQWVKFGIPLTFGGLAFGLFPVGIVELGALAKEAGAVAILGGIGSALTIARSASNSLPSTITAQISSALLLVGLLAISCSWAMDVQCRLSPEGAFCTFRHGVEARVSDDLAGTPKTACDCLAACGCEAAGAAPQQSGGDAADGQDSPEDWTLWFFFVSLAVALATAKWVNVNYISVHRYYRDRLMESFMPDNEAIAANATLQAKGADRTTVAELWNPGAPGESGGGPYHIVNTNVILVDSKTRKYNVRGGDNLFISPLYCGGFAVKFHPTREFADGHMTLSTAMTISGAAANPNSGWAGTGPTRSRLVSWLLAMLNIRLGYWVHNPAAPRRSVHDLIVGSTALNHFGAFRYEVWRGGRFREDSDWLQLSDGGHFENLAIYEMIRRRARLIVVLDGGADPEYGFADLQNTVRRIGQDFKASVTFGRPFWDDPKKTADRLQPDNDEESEALALLRRDHAMNRISSLVPHYPVGFPVGGKVTEHGYVIGVIDYPKDGELPQEKGILVYAKATMIRGLSLETRGYKVTNPTFPHQSTIDQFFDEAQFEAYREVGYLVGRDMIEHGRLADLLATTQ